MLDNMRRLHPRGAANRGICVDDEGAMLGPDVVLVRRTPQGYRSLGRSEASALQKSLHGFDRDEDWLLDQCGRIAASLARGELALAQIYGLRIPTDDLEDRRHRFAKAGFDPSQPRVPKGDPDGGQWVDAGGGKGGTSSPSSSTADDSGTAAQPPAILSTEKPGASEPEPPASANADSNQKPPIEWNFKLPDQEPDTAKARNSLLRSLAIGLGRAIALFGSADPRVRIALQAIEATAWVAQYLPLALSYFDPPRTLEDLEDAVAEPRYGYQTHHIVEAQSGSTDPSSNFRQFGDRLSSRENLVLVPYWKHVEISSWYSRRNEEFGNMRPRDYLRGRSWQEQYTTGIRVLRDFGVLK